MPPAFHLSHDRFCCQSPSQRNLEFKDTPLPLGGAVKRPTASVDAAPSAPSFSTPAESSSAAEQRRAAAAAAGPGLSVLYWDDPFQTGILFGLTVATFAAFTYAAYGRHGITFMQGACGGKLQCSLPFDCRLLARVDKKLGWPVDGSGTWLRVWQWRRGNCCSSCCRPCSSRVQRYQYVTLIIDAATECFIACVL